MNPQLLRLRKIGPHAWRSVPDDRWTLCSIQPPAGSLWKRWQITDETVGHTFYAPSLAEAARRVQEGESDEAMLISAEANAQ